MENSNIEINRLLAEAYASRSSNLDHSLKAASAALVLSRDKDEKRLIAKSLTQLSLYHMILGDYDLSTSLATEAIEYYENLEDERGIAEAKYNIAGVYYKTDNFHLGLTYLIDCLKIYEKYSDYHNQSRAHKSLGTIYEYISDTNSAASSYEKAIEMARLAGDPDLESNTLNNLSGLLLKQGKTEQAMTMIEKSIMMKKQSGDTRGYAFAIYGLGKALSACGFYEEAEKAYLKSVAVHRKMGERLGLAMAMNKLGGLYHTVGRISDATINAHESLEICKKYNIAIISFKCFHLLYRIHKSEGNHILSLEYLEKYIAQREKVINIQTLKVIENYEMIVKMKTLEKEAEMMKERASLIEKKNRAEEGIRVRQEFLSNMSHEIRTPLNAITTIVSLLGQQANEEDKILLESMRFASNNLIRIINDILDFTKLDEGKSHIDFDPTDIKLLCRNIINTYEGMAVEKGLALELQLDPKIADTYLLDQTKFGQITGNLISNAIKFTESGKVSMELSLTKQGLTHDSVMVRVTDTGEGIAAKDLNEIFESFSQIKPVMTRKQGGTGLGLAIVKKLVALFESTIHVESTPGSGSLFYFELILEKTIPEILVTEKVRHQLTGKTVLLAEDTHINAVLMIKLLSKWGVETDHVVNGKLALERAQQKLYDFILMDIHMPEMNGFEATKSIRIGNTANRMVPIFAVTADIMTKDEEQFADYFTGFLWKPLEIDKLHSALAKATVLT